MRGARETGATMIELVISIVVIAIAVGAVLGLLSSSTAHSADAMVLSQAVSLSQAYIEEISLKPFADPDGPSGPNGETNRIDFDDVYDYHGLVDVGAHDQFGNPIPALTRYTVSVAVVPSTALTGVPSTDAARIDVRVQFAPSIDMSLSGYKTRL
jgi:MSHA pilin protein MshD